MPLRGLTAGIRPGSAQKIYTARAGDLEIQVRSGSLPGQAQAIQTYSIVVGGPELEHDLHAGVFCSDGSFSTQIEEGDEIWAGVPDKAVPWSDGEVRVSVLVRSRRKREGDEQGENG